MQKPGGSFQNWKYFPTKNLGRLLTHALPQPTPPKSTLEKVLSHFQPTPTYLNNITPAPKNLPTKIPTTIEIPTFINPTPKQTQTQNTKTPQNPKIIKKSNKLIINNRWKE